MSTNAANEYPISTAVVRQKIMECLASFRAIVPEGTTMLPPKIQQAWRDRATGEIEWRTIDRVVVSDAEFHAA